MSRSNPTTPDVAQFPQNRLPASATAPFAGNFRDAYAQPHPYPSGQPQRMSTQATASILRDSAQQYRNNVTLPPSEVRDLSGFEGFGPLSAPVESGVSVIADPGSPIGNKSSSFIANLLPQELFRALEGDQTPSESKLDLEARRTPWISKNQSPDLPYPLPTKSGLSRRRKPCHRLPLMSTHPEQRSVARGVPKLAGSECGIATSSNSECGLRQSLASPMGLLVPAQRPRWIFTLLGLLNSSDRHSTLGFTLAQTTSNESLPVPNAGYTNAFAPSADEEKTLRWSSLDKWSNVNQSRQETPFAHPSPFQSSEGATGRSISAEHNTKYA